MSETQRPKSASVNARPVRPWAAKERPHTTQPATHPDNLYPYIKEIQAKLKPTDFSVPIGVDFEKELSGRKPLVGLLQNKLPSATPKTAHKRYTSVYPCSSKILAKKWDDHTWKKHKEKIKTMKACIDNTLIPSVPSQLRSLKKNIAKQEHERKIQRENEILIQRMARTFMKPSQFTNFEQAHQKTLQDLEQKSKANMRTREQRMEKIDRENKLLLKRLENKRPSYEQKQWKKETKGHLRLLLNMTKFPEAYKTALARERSRAAKGARPASTRTTIASTPKQPLKPRMLYSAPNKKPVMTV